MATPQNNNRNESTVNEGRGERLSSVPNDLPDSPADRERLQPEETIINLPDVSDIPGQENVHVPRMESFADTTIASDDEEGTRVFGDDEEDDDEDLDLRTGTEGDVSREERQTLADSNYMPTRDEDNLRRASMDATDFDGEALNEGSFGTRQTGADLDIPEITDETATTAMGDGDEENKEYSIGSSDNDNVVEGTP